MGVITRLKDRNKVKHKRGPQRRHKEYDTLKKSGIFKLLFKDKENYKTFKQICDEENVFTYIIRE